MEKTRSGTISQLAVLRVAAWSVMADGWRTGRRSHVTHRIHPHLLTVMPRTICLIMNRFRGR